jgi:tetratricopeptide (TPR) repeat protein
MAADATDAGTKLEVAYVMGKVAREAGDLALYAPYLEQAMAASAGSDDENVQKFREYLEPEYVLLVEDQPAQAIRLKKEALPEGWQDDPGELNGFAWWCFQNRVNLEEAEDLALKGARLATDAAVRANILDTAAEICNARGDGTRAIELMEKAIELDPDKAYFREQLERFRRQQAENQG